MIVHFLKDYGDRYGVHHKAGSEADMPDHIAAKLLNIGLARFVEDPDPQPTIRVMTTMVEAPETAAPMSTKRGPGRPRKAE